MQLTHEQLINLLGGTVTVSKICGTSAGAVTHWKTKGIPKGQLIFLASLIEEKSKKLITRQNLFPEEYKIIWPELQ